MNLLLLGEKIKLRFPISNDLEKDYGDPRAAVLVILFPVNGETFVLMIKRARHLERHAGEIAFPGGMFDPDDKDLLQTALRETREELQMEIAKDSVLGRLATVTTSSGVNVTPFVALVSNLPRHVINVAEVELALEMPLSALLATRRGNPDPKAGGDMFLFQEHCIWGASAKILRNIAQLGVAWQFNHPD